MTAPQQLDYLIAKKNFEEAKFRLVELKKFHEVRQLSDPTLSKEEFEFHSKMELRCIRDSKFLEAWHTLGGCEQELIHWAKGMIINQHEVPKSLKKQMLEQFKLARFRDCREILIEFCMNLSFTGAKKQ